MRLCEGCGTSIVGVTQLVTMTVIEAREVVGFTDSGHPVYGEITTEDSFDGSYIYVCGGCGRGLSNEEAMAWIKEISHVG